MGYGFGFSCALAPIPIPFNVFPDTRTAVTVSPSNRLPQPARSSRNRAAIRLITLDLDDTLWPCAPVIQAADDAVQTWLSLHAPRLAAAHDVQSQRRHRRQIIEAAPEIAHDVGQIRHRSLGALLAEFGYPARLADDAMTLFMAHRNRVEPYADVPPVLRSLAARYCLISVTNGNADVEATPLRGIFRHHLTAAEVGAAKPDPAIFNRALELTGCQPADCLHLGDDPWMDVEAARACGLHAVWINRTGRDWPPELKPPLAAVTNLHQFAAWMTGAHNGDDDGV